MKEALKKAIDKASELLAKKEDENEYHLHEVDRKWVIEAMMDYAEYVLSGMSEKPTNHTLFQTDENGKPLKYWGGLTDRTCTNSCSVVCGECQIFNISDDCEEVKNWDSFVHKKNQELTSSQKEISDKEIFYQKQVMNPYPSTKHFHTAWEKGFMNCANWMREQLKQK